MGKIITREEKVKALLANAHKQIKSILADEKKANRFTAMALTIANSKELRECEPHSIVETLIGVAMLNLSPDKNLGQAYAVPYNTKNGKLAQLQIGYRGYIVILDRSGFSVKAFVVYDVDEFDIQISEDGWEEKIYFKPNYEERNEGDPKWEWEHLKYAVALAKNKKSGEIHRVIMNKKQIEKIRRMSASQKIFDPQTKKSYVSEEPIHIWAEFPIDMALKTVIKKLAKITPLDEFGAQAVAIDELSDIGKRIDYQKTIETGIVVETEDEKTEQNLAQNSTIDPLDLAAPKTKTEAAEEKITVDSFKELYKSLPKEKKSEFLGYTQGVDLEALNEEELSNFYNEVKAYVGA